MVPVGLLKSTVYTSRWDCRVPTAGERMIVFCGLENMYLFKSEPRGVRSDTEACESISVWPLQAAPRGENREMMCVWWERGIHLLSGQGGSQNLPQSPSDCGELSCLVTFEMRSRCPLCLPRKRGAWEGECGAGMQHPCSGSWFTSFPFLV